MIDDFTREIDHDQRASEDPYVEVLCQIRGVGRYIARLVIAEIGDITPADHVPPSLTVSGLVPGRAAPWGIEEELMILDPESFALVNAIEELLEDGRGRELDQARAA